MKLLQSTFLTTFIALAVSLPSYAQDNTTSTSSTNTQDRTTTSVNSTTNGYQKSTNTANSANAQDRTTTGSISGPERNSLSAIATIDAEEIIAGVVAKNKNVNSNVTDFANTMIDQHGSNLTQILGMANPSKTELNSNEATKLAHEGIQNLVKLGSLQGDEFARAYADAMVKGHEAALKLIDDKLMKTAKSEEVKNFLTNTRSTVAQHLEAAKKLQADLK